MLCYSNGTDNNYNWRDLKLNNEDDYHHYNYHYHHHHHQHEKISRWLPAKHCVRLMQQFQQRVTIGPNRDAFHRCVVKDSKSWFSVHQKKTTLQLPATPKCHASNNVDIINRFAHRRRSTSFGAARSNRYVYRQSVQCTRLGLLHAWVYLVKSYVAGIISQRGRLCRTSFLSRTDWRDAIACTDLFQLRL